MTHEAKARIQSTFRRVTSDLLLAAVAAFGTHLVDIVAVKDRVDNIRAEQIENSAWRVTSKAELDKIEGVELPSLLQGQWYLNLRLCKYLVTHGEADKECTSELYKDWESKQPIK